MSEDRVNILLVDDRPENLLALEAILEPLGQRLVRASSGEEALKRLLTMEFAVILLDVQMPGMNGFDTARLIKARERSRHIPIIFLTAISKEEAYVFEGYSVGAVDYMFKPFQPDILRSKVAVFVDLYRKQEQIKHQDELLRESEKRELELRHRAELRETQARLAEVVDGALDAIVMFDEKQRVTLFNEAAERMFCVPAREVVGTSVGRLFPEAARERQIAHILECGEHEPDETCASTQPLPRQVTSFLALRQTMEEFPLEASVSRLAEGSRVVYTLIGRDVTERVRAERELKEQAESLARTSDELRIANDELQRRQAELERAMNARSRFYASMSHELRTPINAILGYSTLLLENIYGPLSDKQAEGIQRTHKAAKHLLELVNDVLDLSKIEAGKIDIKLQPVSFPDLIEDLFVTVRPLADERGSTLTLEHQGDKMTIQSDPRRVRQILLNLLSNAIKFGLGKPITVRAFIRGDGQFEVEVADQGIGIAPDDLTRIFDEFVQIGKGALQQEGTGLGLPISKRLAILLQGELLVDSEVGKGSRFHLVLPQTIDPKMPQSELEPAGAGAAAG
ncbi:MAG: response regulator [Gemmatimonadaceae bacterium]|nr:response regulator [Gemmatimonadaceae bacterium]NUQ92202.1 response regulator [Gemmatimonadaceae bacterium]NUS98378.1 response regulator [Gemmatimonadaceae bacterium]